MPRNGFWNNKLTYLLTYLLNVLWQKQYFRTGTLKSTTGNVPHCPYKVGTYDMAQSNKLTFQILLPMFSVLHMILLAETASFVQQVTLTVWYGMVSYGMVR